MTLTYLVMVAVNYLANALPLNGRGTGESPRRTRACSRRLGSRSAGVIYLPLGAHVLYQ